MRLSGLLNLRRSGQAKKVTVPGAAQWVTHSTCLNDQLEVKVQRIVTARPMSLMGHSRRLKHLAATSAITLNAGIRLHCNICRNGPTSNIPSAGRLTQIKDPGLTRATLEVTKWEGPMAINIARRKL